MDDRYRRRPVAGWYMIGAIAALLFMAVACAGFVIDVTTDPDALPLDQRVVAVARPMWAMAAYGIAVFSGLLGGILLVLKRRLAEHLLLVSLLAAVVTFSCYVVVPGVRDAITTNDMAVALIIIAITWTIFWFARHSRQRGWLR